METYIRQRQLIMSPLIPSRVIGENEPLTAVFNKVIATREVNHKGQGKTGSTPRAPPAVPQSAPWPRVCLTGPPRVFSRRAVRDPEAAPRRPGPGAEGLPPLCGPQHGHRQENGLPGNHPPRWVGAAAAVLRAPSLLLTRTCD